MKEGMGVMCLGKEDIYSSQKGWGGGGGGLPSRLDMGLSSRLSV